MLDGSTEFGQRATRRLNEEIIGWLTTVSPTGQPQPIPVWFLWDGESFLLYSRPGQAKLANIARSPRVSLNLDGDGSGGDIVVGTSLRTVCNPHLPDPEDAPHIAVDVTDNGCGIPPETHAKVFEPFFTTKDVGRGSGLGLSQVLGFAVQSGGFAELRSALGEGTTVSLYFPVQEGDA